MSTTTKITYTIIFAMLASLPKAAADDGCVPPPTGMIAWWPGDGNAKDIVGGRHGSASQAVFTTGFVADAFSFGGGGSINAPDDPVWTLGTNDFTIDLWVRFYSFTGRDPFIAHDTGGGGQNKWIFWYDTSGHDKQNGVPALRLHINGSGVFPHDAVVAPWNPTTGQWYHLAVTRSGTTYALFIDGVQVATDTSPYSIPDPAGSLTIGSAEAYHLNGAVDEVELFGRALSASEIQAIYNAGSAGKVKGDTESFLWARAGDGNMYGRAVAAFQDGSSIVIGSFNDGVTIGAGGPNETHLVGPTSSFTVVFPDGYTVSGQAGVFVARYEANGALDWVRSIGPSPSGGFAYAGGAAGLADGSSIVTGYFAGSATFGAGEPNETTLLTSGLSVFLARHNPDGSLAWARQATGTRDIHALDVEAFPDGSAIVTGRFTDSATFGAGEANATVLSGSAVDGTSFFYTYTFVARYNADGSLAWAKRAGTATSGNAYSNGIGVFPDGSSVVTGGLYGSVTFGIGEPSETTVTAATGAFVARYGADGFLAWVRRADTTGGEVSPTGAGAFPDGSFIVTGFYSRNATFGAGEPNEITLVDPTNLNHSRAFVARYNADGALAWARDAGGTGYGSGYAFPRGVGVFPDGTSVVTGSYSGSLTFGRYEPNETTLFASYFESFVARYESNGSLKWAKRAGGTGPLSSSMDAYGVAAVPDGSTIVTGRFNGSVTFGPGEKDETTLAAHGGFGMFVARYAAGQTLKIVAPESVVQECDGADEGGEAHATVTFSFDVQGAPSASAMLTVRDVTGNRTLLEQAATDGTFDVGPYGFPMGASTVIIQIADDGIVLASAAVSVQVQDTLVPVLSGVGPKTIELQGPLTMLYGSLLGISAMDDCDPNPSLTFVPAAVPLGVTLVTATATDATGGFSAWPFDVTVVDTTPPTFDAVPSDIERECVGGSAIVNFDILATDLSGAAALTCTDEGGRSVDPAGTTFDDGVHTVTCVASDSSGNEATVAFTVTVRDTMDPVIVAPDDITVPTEPGVSFAYVTFSVTATDNCDPSVPIVCTTPLGEVQSGDAFPLGLTTVTCTAIDDAGNEAAATFQILVRDLEPPVLTCPAAVTLHTDAAGSTLAITPQALGASATDNCDPMPLVFCTPATAALGTTAVTVTARDADGNGSTAAVDVTVLLPGQETTRPGTDVAVTPQAELPDGSTAPVTITFDQVTADGVTTVTTAPTGPPPPNGFRLGSPPIYYDVSTTAQFTGSVELCFTWQEGQVQNESKLKLFHHDGTKWVDVTTSVDTVNNVMCGVVTSLSPFLLAEPGYTFGGILQPIAADGSSVFKRGRVVPVKFGLLDPDGAEALGAVVTLKLVKISNSVLGTVEEEIDPATVGSANEGSLFRYDADGHQFIYNLATSGLTAGTYRLEILPDDGSKHTAQISLRN